MKFYNTNERYGDEGPFEAESKEELADSMAHLFRVFALEAATHEPEAHDGDGDLDEGWLDWAVNGPDGYREEFLDGLKSELEMEEIRDLS